MAVTSIYRLIKFGGARRVLFLVDRGNLGEQAEKEFQGYRTPDDQRKFTEIIETYPDDRPFPSALFLSFAATRPIHVVAALDPDVPEAYMITVYEPTADHFEADWRTRRKP